jgi:Leucine-rich repeat (LRR) protein
MENKNLPTIKQSTEVALSRANTLMDMADKILAKQSTDLVDESWMERLWQWADDNDIYEHNLPRDREGLVNITRLGLYNNKLTELPKEIGNLVDLTTLGLEGNQLTELPKELQEWFNNIENT